MSLGWASMPVDVSSTADHRLIESPLRSPWRINRSLVMTAESIRGLVGLSGSPGVSGVLGGDSRSRTHRGRLTGSRDIGRDGGARGWITCDPRGTWPELASRGTSGEAAGRLVEEKVGVTAGIVTVWNGFAPDSGGIGFSGGLLHRVIILLAWHVAHPLTYSWTNF